MYNLFKDIIGYVASGTNYNYEQYILYGCIAMLCISVVVTIDLIYKLFLRFLPKDSKQLVILQITYILFVVLF